jgi:hypothetical protein
VSIRVTVIGSFDFVVVVVVLLFFFFLALLVPYSLLAELIVIATEAFSVRFAVSWCTCGEMLQEAGGGCEQPLSPCLSRAEGIEGFFRSGSDLVRVRVAVPNPATFLP